MKKGGVFFGGIFFLAGLVAFYFIVLSAVIDASRMQFWQATKAQLNSADVSSFQSRNDNGGYTTMYKLDIQYRYKVAGTDYFGNRAKIRNDNSTSDSSDAYTLLSKVNHEQSSQQSITVWYNPSNVNESIYDRTLDFQFLLMMTLFSSVFMAIGLGIISYSRPEKEEKPVNANPEKPWTTRSQWASPIIYSNAQMSVKYAWYFAIVSGLFFGMFSVALFGQNPIATIFSLLFLVVPLWLVIRARRIQKEWLYFKKVPLTLGTYPGLVGGKVKGSLTIPGQSSASEKCTVTLNCTKYWTERSGSKTESNQSIIYSKAQITIARPSLKGSNIDFSFDVPADKPQSSAPSKSYHKWTIAIKGNLSGFNFNREYEVPVFVTQESMSVADELQQKPLTSSEKSAMNKRLAVDVSLVKEEMTLHTPGSKDSLFIAGIGAIFFIIGISIATIGGSLFGLVFAAMSFVFLGLGTWGYGRNCKIKVKPDSLQVDVYFFSRPVKTVLLDKTEVDSIEAFSSSKEHTNGKQTSEKFCLRLLTNTGKRIDLGGDFNSMKNALHLKQRIEQLFEVVEPMASITESNAKL
ncbi:DUF3592 domain-containing protein [Colwellia sp. 12G3]|uniref:DUF3592 domain-containing protein n=1 Tax=Colwellia sp. 12G3 TaxID=2058299 RepID=UPI0012FF2A8D|nr:DUF3592 domain-containing protein [Colwellia sp. 12G3]